jgi:hypothetical protein
MGNLPLELDDMSEFPERFELESDGRRTAYVLRRDVHAAYEAVPGGQLVYPTGSVWVRFAEGIDAKSRAADLERAGFRIERSPGYAPNGAFVTAGDTAYALSHLDALRAIEGVEHVEPQMLREASLR